MLNIILKQNKPTNTHANIHKTNNIHTYIATTKNKQTHIQTNKQTNKQTNTAKFEQSNTTDILLTRHNVILAGYCQTVTIGNKWCV